MSTSGFCHGLGSSLGFGHATSVVFIPESSVRSVISMVLCKHDAVDVLSVSAAVGSCGSIQDWMNLTNLVMY